MEDPSKGFESHAARLLEFISSHGEASSHPETEAAFNQLAVSLFGLQCANVPIYQEFCKARGVSPAEVSHWTQIPAIPTVAFKEAEATSLPMANRTHVFHSSGTTGQVPSRHFHSQESLAIYQASLLPRFKRNVLEDWLEGQGGSESPLLFQSLTPSTKAAPNSSLVHMFETVRREFFPQQGPSETFLAQPDRDGAWVLGCDRVAEGLLRAIEAQRPVLLVGTAFSFVHWLDWCREQRRSFKLPEGSRVMETGGYKGRSRAVPKQELHAAVAELHGLPKQRIITEYGMSELSSQAYDTEDKATGARLFQFPPWVRWQVICPATGLEAKHGQAGLIRIWDLANHRSIASLQTEDLGIARDGGFELLGRPTAAEPRGCSLQAAWDSDPNPKK